MNQREESILVELQPWMREFVNASSLFFHMQQDQFRIGDALHNEFRDDAIPFADKYDLFLTKVRALKDKGVFRSVIDALRQSGQEWLAEVLEKSEKDENFDKGNWSEVMRKLDEVNVMKNAAKLISKSAENADAKFVCNSLIDNDVITREDCERINAEQDRFGNICAMRFIIFVLVRKKPGWIQQLAEIAKEAGYEELQELCELLQSYDSPLTAELLPVELEGDVKSVAGKFEDGLDKKLNAMALEDNTVNQLKSDDAKRDIILRNYQLELSKAACEGKNVIICAPTGSGKTHVACNIIENHLKGNREGKVVFFVPRVSLAKQQYQCIESYLKQKARVDYLVGSMGQRPEHVIHQCDVLVLTPALFLNAIDSERFYSVAQFSLLIFDECHHTDKETPYMKIMYDYIKLKLIEESENLPQVVGLTATPGTGKKLEEASVQKYMMNLCANLDAEYGIITVMEMENLEELHKHTPFPEEEHMSTQETADDPFEEKICQFMDQMIEKIFDIPIPHEIRSKIGRPSQYKGTQPFMQWCRNLEENIPASSLQNNEETNNIADITVLSKYLGVFNNALVMHFKCRAIDALELLKRDLPTETTERNLSELKKSMFKESENVLKQLEKSMTDDRCKNSNLQKIEDKLYSTFLKEPKTRAIIIVPQRKYTVVMKNWLLNCDRLKQFQINPEAITGTGKGRGRSTPETGLTHNQQEMVLDMFKKGDTKVIVSTPAAVDEGVDVDECNLVVCYDYIKTEIGYKQIKGRVRKDNGSVVNISSRTVAAEDVMNVRKALLMNQNIKKLYSRRKENPKKFCEDLREMQNTIIEERDIKIKQKEKKLSSKESGTTFKIICKEPTCHAFVGYSYDIRVINNNAHICTHSDFNEKFITKMENNNTGDILCKTCESKWGKVTNFKRIVIHQLQPDCFIFMNAESNDIILKRKWKDVPFKPAVMEYGELLKLKYTNQY